MPTSRRAADGGGFPAEGRVEAMNDSVSIARRGCMRMGIVKRRNERRLPD
jgi:hypothetical protein